MEALAPRRAGSHTFGCLNARSLSGTLFHLAITPNPQDPRRPSVFTALRPNLTRAELLPDHNVEQIMSMSAVSPRRWTRAEVDRLIDERPGYAPRYELVGGELLVTPAPDYWIVDVAAFFASVADGAPPGVTPHIRSMMKVFGL